MPNSLAGRIALVTGAAGPDIGQKVSIRLAEQGAHVIVTDRSERRLDIVGKELQARYGSLITPRLMDVREFGQIDGVIGEVARDIGPVDILINNAGITKFARLDETDESDYDEVMLVNLKAPWYLSKAVAPGMKAKGWGRIVNISSLSAYNGGWNEGVYGATKAALNSFTRDFAHELGAAGVTVNSVCPGIMHTAFSEKHWDLYKDHLKRTPTGRFPNADDVADTVSYLVSNGAAMVTGEAINVSGGWFMTP